MTIGRDRYVIAFTMEPGRMYLWTLSVCSDSHRILTGEVGKLGKLGKLGKPGKLLLERALWMEEPSRGGSFEGGSPSVKIGRRRPRFHRVSGIRVSAGWAIRPSSRHPSRSRRCAKDDRTKWCLLPAARVPCQFHAEGEPQAWVSG